VMMGLSQRYMKEEMEIDASGPGVGTVLEVKDTQGFGTTLDAIIYDGTIHKDDTIVVGGLQGPIVTDVRALLRPRPLEEIRTEQQFEQVDAVAAADGVKIAAPDLDDAIAGAPIRVLRDRDRAEVIAEVEEELSEIEVTTQEEGVVVKADTLGSLEAISSTLEEEEIPIMRAEVGAVAPRDVRVAETANEPTHRAILAFSVEVLDDARRLAEQEEVTLFEDDVIYQLVEGYDDHVTEIQESQQEQILENITRPAKFRVLPDHTFRQNDPAVVGIEVLSGELRRNVNVVKWDGNEARRIGRLKSLQDAGEDVDSARTGEQLAASIDGPTVGRQIEEGDDLWVEIPEKHAKILEQELREEISVDEREALSMYLENHRNRDPFWGK